MVGVNWEICTKTMKVSFHFLEYYIRKKNIEKLKEKKLSIFSKNPNNLSKKSIC